MNLDYKVIKSYRKTMSLQVKNGEVIVKAPFFTFGRIIDNFVNKNIAWINKKLELEKNKKKLSLEEILELKKQAQKYIPNRVEELSLKFSCEYNCIKITSAKTRWGSCTSKKNLNFSYRLMCIPKEVIDYVIIHELAHLKHMNHSRLFWKELESMMPDYKNHEKWLKDNGSFIG